MMEWKELIDKVESSETFKSWKKENPDFYLVHLFFMTKQNPQVGYYSAKIDRIVIFEVNGSVVLSPASEVFKEKKTIMKLDIAKVIIDKTQAVGKAIELRNTKYPKDSPMNEITLLQMIDKKPVWNITYFTMSFKTLNIKVSAIDGEIFSDDLSNLISF
jgi:hypothetical protein